jgi:hypothetical protein
MKPFVFSGGVSVQLADWRRMEKQQIAEKAQSHAQSQAPMTSTTKPGRRKWSGWKTAPVENPDPARVASTQLPNTATPTFLF